MTFVETKIKIEAKFLKCINKIAKRENTTKTKIINDMIERGIETKTKNEIPDYLIGNKDTYDPDPKELEKMAGMFSTDKPFDAVELVREMRSGDL